MNAETPAAFFASGTAGHVSCGLCPHRCDIAPGRWGICKTRQNINGLLTVASYGKLLAGAPDPVEKKPLFHYWPGTTTFSVASAGCNLKCPFCQNHQISQPKDNWDFGLTGNVSPEEIVSAAQRAKTASISFTYSEPILMFEIARETAAIAAPAEMDLIFVTNGQATPESAAQIGRFIQAANVDLKCFSEKKYREILRGDLKSTLAVIEAWHTAGVWLEITTLLVPGFNDTDVEIRDTARFIAGIDPSMPWHISRFHPQYKWQDLPPTPEDRILHAREIGLAEGLRFVYTGNLHGGTGEDTYCPSCRAPVIERRGFQVRSVSVKGGCCGKCGEKIAGVGLR